MIYRIYILLLVYCEPDRVQRAGGSFMPSEYGKIINKKTADMRRLQAVKG
jgi:hypothetical protein